MARGTKHFYVVRCGRTPGIYRSWLECNEQVAGFSEAIYKGFKTRKEADIWFQVEEEKNCDFYAVVNGHRSSVYASGTIAGEAMESNPDARVCKHDTKQEDKEYLVKRGIFPEDTCVVQSQFDKYANANFTPNPSAPFNDEFSRLASS